MLDILFSPFLVFQRMPVTALLPAALMLLAMVKASGTRATQPRRLVLFSSFLWIAYACWEYRVSLWAETVTAPIRVDLLLIYPLLIIFTLYAIFALWRWRRTPPQDSE